MPVTSIKTRLDATVTRILEERAAPDDIVEFETTVLPIETYHLNEGGDPEDEDDWHEHIETFVMLYVALTCHEMDGARSTGQVTLPVSYALWDDNIHKVVNDLWDSLVVTRLEVDLLSEETETEG